MFETVRGRRVAMVASVGDKQAGRSYRLPATVADEWIVKGYARGQLSRHYTPEEQNRLRANAQAVSV